MGSVISLKFVDDVFDVVVNGGFRNRELIGNLFIAMSIADQAQHLKLAGRFVCCGTLFEDQKNTSRNLC